MRQNLIQEPRTSLGLRAYLFLKNRDAIIVELFFILLNLYILTLVILPPNSYEGFDWIWRVSFQAVVTGFNFGSLLFPRKIIRLASSVWNSVLMGYITFALMRNGNAHAGTYALLAVLAMFVCWKINIREE